MYARRKDTVERSFTDAKQHHGYCYARFLGMKKVGAMPAGGDGAEYEEDDAVLSAATGRMRADKA
ncbi:hypothetical protein EC392_14820 [Lonsdalea populi]|uniref:Transposase DDE domain-containing protein n=1 Tax=Lonsdalea populi TaxID=1172565 RepID=A0A3N0U9M2_9GAMM|nr:hypothetical protein EC393_14990 [Lonsdalea populi]ROH76998.1 hypothetical protein EC392_14820 [Lonsdalea populi]ROH81014.1 hypothetical protein EC394_08535 [Lonsdalea populi]